MFHVGYILALTTKASKPSSTSSICCMEEEFAKRGEGRIINVFRSATNGKGNFERSKVLMLKFKGIIKVKFKVQGYFLEFSQLLNTIWV